MLQVKPVTDLSKWDELVESSPQGTIFSTSKWLSLWDNNVVYGVYRGNELIGGIAGFVKDGQFLSGATPLTPFQGTIIMPTEGKWITQLGLQEEVTSAIAYHLKKATVYNHYNLFSIRPYLWAGWKPCGIKYTYIVDVSNTQIFFDNLSKDTRHDVNHIQNRGTDSGSGLVHLDDFYYLYKRTFERKNLEAPIDYKFLEKLFKTLNPTVFLTPTVPRGRVKDTYSSAVVMIEDSKRAYYILGASLGDGTSAFTLSRALHSYCYGFDWQKIKEADLVGCNDQKIDCFKRGFGGILKVYHGVCNV